MEIQNEIVFNGTTYRIMGSGKYYLSQSTSNEGRRHAKGLHVAIWEFYNGRKVPKGYCIHHIDGDTFNNDISNLACEPISQHLSYHSKKNLQNPEYKKKMLENLKQINPLAAEWHHSPEGIAWHKEHAKTLEKAWNFRENRICEVCGKEYVAKTSRSKYCSNSCMQKAQRARFNKQKTCAYCGNPFIATNRRKTCSYECQRALATQSKQGKAS